MSDHFVAETSTWQHTTFTTDKHPRSRWDSNPQSQQASGLRPRGHWDWRNLLLQFIKGNAMLQIQYNTISEVTVAMWTIASLIVSDNITDTDDMHRGSDNASPHTHEVPHAKNSMKTSWMFEAQQLLLIIIIIQSIFTFFGSLHLQMS